MNYVSIWSRTRQGFSMKRAVATIAALLKSASAWADPFVVGCTLPFDGIKQEQDIDLTCPADGDAATTDAHKAQNRAKNNFCASGTPALVTHRTMTELQ